MEGETLGKQETRRTTSVDATLIGIPAYNEAATIGSVVLAVKRYADWIVVIDDGSSDQTAEIARNAGATVFQQDRNGGKGAAIRRLFDYARSSNADTLILLDADWQHNPNEIPDLLARLKLSEADIVVGSRYLEGESGNTPTYRRIGQIILDKLTHVSVGVSVTDSQSGYRAFNQKAIETLDVKHDDFSVEVEMLRRAADNDLRVEEVPISIEYDVPNPSTSNSVLHGVRVIDYLLGIVRDRHPLLFFGIPGLTLMLLGLGTGAWAMTIYEAGNGFYAGKAIYASVMFIVGVISLYSALLMNMIGNRLEQIE